MGKVYIATNLSSKSERRVGKPYVKIDATSQDILGDCVETEVSGKHKIRVGYKSGSAVMEHFNDMIEWDENPRWYHYKAPLFLTKKGKLKEISEFQYRFLKRWKAFWDSKIGFGILLLLLVLLTIIRVIT